MASLFHRHFAPLRVHTCGMNRASIEDTYKQKSAPVPVIFLTAPMSVPFDQIDEIEVCADVLPRDNQEHVCFVVFDAPERGELYPRHVLWGYHRVAPIVLGLVFEGGAPSFKMSAKQCSQTPVSAHGYRLVLPLAAMPPTDMLINIEQAERLLSARMRQYIKPSKKCLVKDDANAIAKEAFSYALARAAIQRNAQVDRRFASAPSQLVRAYWLRGEMAISRYRLAHSHLPSGYKLEADALESVGATRLMFFATHAQATTIPVAAAAAAATYDVSDPPDVVLAEGLVRTLSPALFTLVLVDRMRKQHELALCELFPQLMDHEAVRDLLDGFHVRVRAWGLGAGAAKTSIIGVTDIEDLNKVMPGCMREMAKRAFGSSGPSLKHDDRVTFYHYALHSGVPLQSFTDAVCARYEDDPMRRREMASLAKFTHAKLGREQHDWTGCTQMRNRGWCPYSKSGEELKQARVQCHRQQELFIDLLSNTSLKCASERHRVENERLRRAGDESKKIDLWFKTPFEFSQKVKRVVKERCEEGLSGKGGVAPSVNRPGTLDHFHVKRKAWDM